MVRSMPTLNFHPTLVFSLHMITEVSLSCHKVEEAEVVEVVDSWVVEAEVGVASCKLQLRDI